MTPAGRARISARMKANNPMKDPEVVARAFANRGPECYLKSPEGLARIAAASRKRMLSERNPMKDPVIAQSVHRRNLRDKEPNKTEAWFMEMAKPIMPNLEFCGNGTIWFGRQNPDFFLRGENKVIEVCQDTFFNNGRPGHRTINGYGLPRTADYAKHGIACLVVFLPSKKPKVPNGLRTALWWFAGEGRSGVWRGDEFYPLSAYLDGTASTT